LTKTGSETEDVDVPITGLIAHIQQEIRDRSNSKARVPPLLRSHSSQHESGERKPKNVEILKAQHRSRKTNNFDIVESAQKNWEEKLDQMKETRILAVEVRDGALELLQETRLSDAESWKRAVHSVQANERQYLEQVRDILFSWRSDWSQGEGAREVCVHNFLTRDCIYYDLGA
jgi:translation initiation factor 2-alpha kinase 4